MSIQHDSAALASWLDAIDAMDLSPEYSTSCARLSYARVLQRRDAVSVQYALEVRTRAEAILVEFPGTSEELQETLWRCVHKRTAAHNDAYTRRWAEETTKSLRRTLRKHMLRAKVEALPDGSVRITAAPAHAHSEYRRVLGNHGITRTSFVMPASHRERPPG